MSRAKRLTSRARANAEAHGVPFTLTWEWVLERLRQGKCAATGTEFEFDTRARGDRRVHPLSPSLDRTYPHQGYTPENVEVVCTKHNIAKAESTHDAHVRYCLAFLKHQGVIK